MSRKQTKTLVNECIEKEKKLAADKVEKEYAAKVCQLPDGTWNFFGRHYEKLTDLIDQHCMCPYHSFWYRYMRSNWSIEKALSTPVGFHQDDLSEQLLLLLYLSGKYSRDEICALRNIEKGYLRSLLEGKHRVYRRDQTKHQKV